MDQHHAQVCIASSLEEAGIPQVLKTETTDVTHILCDRLGIDQVRSLRQQAQRTPLVGDQCFFVIVTRTLPTESQNALLKLFEDPPVHAYFYLVIPQEGILLPTLRSRVLLQDIQDTAPHKNTFFEDFLKASYADRLNIVADITKRKDIEHMDDIISGAEQFATARVVTHTTLAQGVLQVRSNWRAPGASAKMLLEEIALLLPIESQL